MGVDSHDNAASAKRISTASVLFRPDFVSDDTRRGGVVGSHQGSEVDDVPSLRVDVAVRDRFFATVDVERVEVPPSAADDTTVLMIRATV